MRSRDEFYVEGKYIPEVHSAGLFVREYIKNNGPSTIYELWRAWHYWKKQMGLKPPTYYSFYQNIVYPLLKLGLLVEVGTTESERGGHRIRRPKVVDVAVYDSDYWYDPKYYLAQERGWSYR